MHSQRIAFMPAKFSRSVLKLRSDGVSILIAKVTCRAYRLLTRPASRALDCSSNWLQASFTAQD